MDVHQNSTVNYVRSYLGNPSGPTVDAPAPATLALFATGLLGLVAWRRRLA